MDPILAAKLIELGIVGLQGFFTLMELSGKTPEEIDQMYLEEKIKFESRPPEGLPNV
jgi:hypothetical protein